MSSIPTLSWYRGKCHLSTWTCSAACDSVGTDHLNTSVARSVKKSTCHPANTTGRLLFLVATDEEDAANQVLDIVRTAKVGKDRLKRVA